METRRTLTFRSHFTLSAGAPQASAFLHAAPRNKSPAINAASCLPYTRGNATRR
jgi:hypothetical protein